MNPLATNSSPAANDHLARRKRGRPRKDGTCFVTTKPESDLIGKEISGVVEGSFDAGYFLNVKVNDTEEKLRGLVFIPGKVTLITPENDVAPNVQMVAREETNQPTEDDITDLEVNNGEAGNEKDGVMVEEAATRLVDFFPTPDTVSAQPNLVETEQQKPLCVGEKVPEMLHLELGNNNIVTVETDAVSKSGFIANLFESQEKKEDEEATPSVH